MPYQTDFSAEGDVLHVRLSGQFPLQLLRAPENVFTPAIDTCSRHGCHKMLIDARNLEVKLDTANLFRAGVDAAFLTQRGLRVAFVGREDMMDGFFEDVARNRGALIGVFTDFDMASEWLVRQQVALDTDRKRNAGS